MVSDNYCDNSTKCYFVYALLEHIRYCHPQVRKNMSSHAEHTLSIQSAFVRLVQTKPQLPIPQFALIVWYRLGVSRHLYEYKPFFGCD